MYSGEMKKDQQKTLVEIQGSGFITGIEVMGKQAEFYQKVLVYKDGELKEQIQLGERTFPINGIKFDRSFELIGIQGADGKDDIRIDIDYAIEFPHVYHMKIDNPTVAVCDCGYETNSHQDMKDHVGGKMRKYNWDDNDYYEVEEADVEIAALKEEIDRGNTRNRILTATNDEWFLKVEEEIAALNKEVDTQQDLKLEAQWKLDRATGKIAALKGKIESLQSVVAVYEHREIALKKQVRELTAAKTDILKRKILLKIEYVRLREALEKISTDIYCDGPGCPWCESGTEHPLTPAAKIAREALGLKEGYEQRA